MLIARPGRDGHPSAPPPPVEPGPEEDGIVPDSMA